MVPLSEILDGPVNQPGLSPDESTVGGNLGCRVAT